MEDAYNDALERSKLLPEQPTHVQLNLYGLYKQSKLGNADGKRPGVFDVRGRAKYDAWESRRGMSQAEAKTAYVEYVDELEG